MMTGKCNLLKPVDNATGTFLMFSQYAQDLTKQYTQPDSWRCVPSKYIALNLDMSALSGAEHPEVMLGEIMQDYFENACTVWRGELKTSSSEMDPELTRTLLFQTLQRYGLMTIDSTATSNGVTVSGVSPNIQHIGDVNIYSYDTNPDGVGYNEIYVNIPNDAHAHDYSLNAADALDPVKYTSDYISGYEGQSSYNGLTWLVDGYTDEFEIDGAVSPSYGMGQYCVTSVESTLVPYCLEANSGVNEEPSDPEREADSFDVNCIILMYDIYTPVNGVHSAHHRNIPLGMYFTGKPVADAGEVSMTNVVHKFVSNSSIYNQGTSYGLRVCSRFTFNPNSTEVIESSSATGSAVAEIAPVIGKFNEAIGEMNRVVAGQAAMSTAFNNHLALFRNNKTNVPYVRTIGGKKYWFVNGKNTGAVAEYDFEVTDEMINTIVQSLIDQGIYYTKDDIDSKFDEYPSAIWVEDKLQRLRNDVQGMFDEFDARLDIYTL